MGHGKLRMGAPFVGTAAAAAIITQNLGWYD
jgi:hypothetical protein